MNNRLIVFEGVDGVGKSTLARALHKALRSKKISAVVYEDVENRRVGFNRIKPFVKKEVPVNASLLFYLASALYKSKKIEEILKTRWVICDRYVYSTLAYHRAAGADMGLVAPLKRFPIRIPDVLFLITAGETARLQRVTKRLGNQPEDLRKKTAGSRVAQMEQALKAFHPHIIDNSAPGIANAIEQVLQVLAPLL